MCIVLGNTHVRCDNHSLFRGPFEVWRHVGVTKGVSHVLEEKLGQMVDHDKSLKAHNSAMAARNYMKLIEIIPGSTRNLCI